MKVSKTRNEESESLDQFDPAMMDAAIRIMSALIGKHGVIKPTPGEAEQVAAAAHTYAKSLVQRVRA